MTTIQDINIIGITNQAITNLAKTTAFIFDSEDQTVFGIVGFTGACWQVTNLGLSMEHDLKLKLRTKVARAIPSDYPIIEDSISFFHDQKRILKEASASQKDYINKLYGSCLQPLYAQYAADIINTMKVHDLFMTPKFLSVHRELFAEEQSHIT